jgi:signal transduction histidine kinase
VPFVQSLWFVVLSALSLFSFLMLLQQLFVPDIPSPWRSVFLLGAIWLLGIGLATAIHILYLRSERALRRAARDEAAVQLAGAVAHELNQPLTVVIAGAELMSRRNRSPEELLALSKRMAEASNRMADVVEKLQKVKCYRSKPYVGEIRIVDLDRCG